MTDNATFGGLPEPLSAEALEIVGTGAQRISDTLGVRIDSPEALSLLADLGVRCDHRSGRAFPSGSDVARALDTVTRGYTLHERRPGGRVLPVDSRHTYTVSGGAALRMFADGQYATATWDDLIDTTVLHQALDQVDVLIDVVEPPELEQGTLYPVVAAVLLSYSTKPLLLQAGRREDLRKIVRMMTLVAGSEAALRARPLFMTGTNAEPPLQIGKEGAEVLIDAARAGVPVSLGDYMVLGSTGPMHFLAAQAQRTATVLTGLVLTQAAAPGSIYDFSCHSGACDLRTGDTVTMSPDVLRMCAASVQVGRHYDLVTHSLACTEARGPDAQAVAERSMALVAAFLSGATFVHHATCCMAGMELADHAQSVLDNELIGRARGLTQSTEAEGFEEALAALGEVVTDPLYAGLGFLGHPHTAARCRRSSPGETLFEAGQLARWLTGERTGIAERAERVAQEVLREKQACVPNDLQEELFAIARE